jgi:hypothetical protein
VILGGFVVFWSVVALLKNNRFAWSIPASLLLVALLPISFASMSDKLGVMQTFLAR